MKKFYSLATTFYLLLFTAHAYNSRISGLMVQQGVDTAKKATIKVTTKITDTRKDKPAYLKNGVAVNIVPFKPAAIKPAGTSSTTSTAKPASPDLKVVSNVKVYPNPVADQLNLSYSVNKDSNVTIKIMDVLGNEIATLLSQRIPAGEQVNSFPIASKLNSGYYFIRLVVGNETVVKRISIM
ncbi:T9SS type A sorting domain-containing protein [Pedobacter sp. SYSU D00535]|uniref:T9SS type A sorting domain-containing protein n=1 Tax=Pedobacter sp. SYSU D00535 TaxID=2810308 RepID=UPI001A96DC9C|nr:T9SS type A sorting domain-containing protein [Pedobacter sp. SYSU D00535]